MASKTVKTVNHRYVHESDVEKYKGKGWTLATKHPKGEPVNHKALVMMEKVTTETVEVIEEPKKEESKKK